MAENAATPQKLRGGYYTPPAIARFLADWAVTSPTDTILEPSCGDGELACAAAKRLLALSASPAEVGERLRAIELFAEEADKARGRLAALGLTAPGLVHIGDFFDYEEQAWGLVSGRFDAVVGNPPFLRYHSFPEEQRQRAFRIMQTAGLTPNRLTNSWVPFLVAASLCLNDGGRLAMVIPAELLQVKYAEQTRAFLARHFGAITIVTFRRLVFEGIQQEIVLLLAEKQPRVESGIDVVELGDEGDLAGYEVTLRETRHLKRLDHAEEKWTQYYLDQDEIDLLRAARKNLALPRFGAFGCVDVGVVTGNNDFFVLKQADIEARQLSGLTLPLVGRTYQLPGIIFDGEEWGRQSASNVPCHLLNLPAVPFDELPPGAQAYVREGETREAHKGFKCRNRRLWHVAPSLWTPDAFLFRQIHHYPKLVNNQAAATSTDTVHRVRLHHPAEGPQVCAAFLNSLTFAFAEVFGRSYGGGVLELEPNEADHLPLPCYPDAPLDVAEIDRLEREGKIDAILDITDSALIQGRAGLDASDARRFRTIWRKLSSRRVNRKARSKVAAGGA